MNRFFKYPCISCLCLFFFLSGELPAQSFHPDIMIIRQNFKNFEYQNVIDSSLTLLNRSAINDTSDLLELYRLMGVSYYSIGRMDSSLATFIRLLSIAPDYELDKRENSPKITAFFEEIRQLFFRDNQSDGPVPADDRRGGKTTAEDSLLVPSPIWCLACFEA